MNPRVKDVIPEPNFTLRITFTNGEVRIFNTHPFLNKGILHQTYHAVVCRSHSLKSGSAIS